MYTYIFFYQDGLLAIVIFYGIDWKKQQDIK